MNQHRISMSDLVVGKPLPWDVYDSAGQLLLRKGYVVELSKQIETLVERGLFINAKSMRRNSTRPSKEDELPSALRLINLVNKRLARLFLNLSNETDAQAKFIEVAKALIYATKINSDVALASILLNQESTTYPARHCVDTAVVSLLVTRSLNQSEDQILMTTAAALTMNVSMVRMQEQLQNAQTSLTDEQLKAIHDHPQAGVNLLKLSGIDNADWLSYVLNHHENEDGSGYPLGAVGKDIVLNAKIISIADRYCARVSARQYRKTLLPNAALRDMLLSDKKNLDPVLVTSFIRELGIYPTGTFVRLENGEIGVVTGKGASTTTPQVHALIGPKGAPLAYPIKRDTAKQLSAIRDVLYEEGAAAHFTMQQLWGN